MSSFNELQNIWNQQPQSVRGPQPVEIIRRAEDNTRKIKRKHQWTIGLLVVTVLVLSWYFMVYGIRATNTFSWGLCTMILSLVLRILLEYISYRKFQQIDIRSDFNTYAENIRRFYMRRKKLNYLYTPLILLAYSIGFLLLLPVFRQVFSSFFFWYIVLSGTIVLVLFAWMVTKQAKKEMQLLDFLKDIKNTETN
jgi:4-amino-4-deoxy-L-arabinose transferase-like glycosyltransferase